VDDSTSNIKATVPPRQYSASKACGDGGNRRPFYLLLLGFIDLKNLMDYLLLYCKQLVEFLYITLKGVVFGYNLYSNG